jgi:hypothetical protein
MNNLDRFMEFLAAGVFLCVGLRNIWSYRRRPKPLGASNMRLPFGLPYGTIVAVGVFEIAAALVLLIPFGPWPQAVLVRMAALSLAFLMIAAGIYRVRRHEPAAPTAVLFLLTLFVIVGRW